MKHFSAGFNTPPAEWTLRRIAESRTVSSHNKDFKIQVVIIRGEGNKYNIKIKITKFQIPCFTGVSDLRLVQMEFLRKQHC